jgi:uncharacterized protein YndB with AHSA1/START domain
MANQEIRHRVGIKASPDTIYQALTDVEKLAQWWTTDTRGESKTGKTLEFWFGEFVQEIQVTALKAGKLVQWQPTGKGLADWGGTEIEFRITPADDQTHVHFRHSGWRDDNEMFPHYSMSWAVFLLSLKHLLETGKGRPYPDDWKR